MDQAEPESEELSGDDDERGEDPALDCLVCVFDPVVSQVSVENWPIHAAYVANFTAQFI